MYLRRLIGVFIITIITVTLMGKLFDYRYKKRWSWLYFDKIDTAISGTKNYDILFFGNSRIHTGINPYYVDSVTRMNSYNLAIGSGDEVEMKLLASVYLQNHRPPKFVVLGLDKSLLVRHNILKERFAYLFYLCNDTIFESMRETGFPCGLIKAMPFLKYSFFDEYNRTSLFVGDGKIKRLFKHNYYNGFINIFQSAEADSISTSKLFNTIPVDVNINDTSVTTIRQLVEMFLSRKTRVIFVFPPLRQDNRSERAPAADSTYINLALQYHIPIIRADKNAAFTRKYFLGKEHVNEPGSEIFSLVVADFIKSLN